MKIACISLGCPKNQVDLDGMVHILLSAGHETVADLGEADVILVNTCGFIESAKTEAIKNILEACSYKQANPNLKVIVTGCLAERYRSQIEEEIPEVDAEKAFMPAVTLLQAQLPLFWLWALAKRLPQPLMNI